MNDVDVAESPQKHPGGRPLKFKNARVLQRAANKYFEATPQTEWTITGLALALDTNRHTLINIARDDEFFHTVKQIKAKIEYAYELRGMDKSTAFDIFRLKNMGWTDNQNLSIQGAMLTADVSLDPNIALSFQNYLKDHS